MNSKKPKAFVSSDGFSDSWKLCQQYLEGSAGRLATVEDVVDGRLGQALHYKTYAPWWQEGYFTTTSGEYLGYTKGGTLVIIVAHGRGPLATLEGALRAYSWTDIPELEKLNNSRSKGGRISRDEFLKLESGYYGDVAIVPFFEYCKRYEYAFYHELRSSEAANDPLFAARIGRRFHQYLEVLTKIGVAFYDGKGYERMMSDTKDMRDDPVVVLLSCDDYRHNYRLSPELGFARLLSVDMMRQCSISGTRVASYFHEISVQDSASEYARFIALPNGCNLKDLVSK